MRDVQGADHVNPPAREGHGFRRFNRAESDVENNDENEGTEPMHIILSLMIN